MNANRRRLAPALAILALLVTPLLASSPAFAETKTDHRYFDGPLIGLEVGLQNYFSGSAIGNVDVLTRDTNVVTDVFVGYRKQLVGGRLLVGLRANYGFADGDLRQTGYLGEFDLVHENDTQIGFGGELGVVLGSRRVLALFAYGYETERDFEVTITSTSGRFRQSDEQGVFRFGVGAELHLRRGLHVRGTVGTGRADFGDRMTSQDVDGRTDFAIGVVAQF